jgi:nucleoside-diphosphate-sugar epimerase
VVREIGELLDKRDLVQLGALPSPPGDPPFVCANSRRLRAETDWRPRFDLSAGLRDTIDWWRTRDGIRAGGAA